MNPNMQAHLPQIDLDKMQAVLDIETRYVTGQITLEEGRQEVADRVGSIRPFHLAFIEQTLIEHTDEECIRENMAQKLQLFEGFMDYSRPNVPEDHPLARYYQENDEMKRLLLAVEDLVQYPVIKNQWLELFDQLRKYPIHFSRKQNQLYPLLEQKGFDRPTTTMWTFDDMVRDHIRDAYHLLETGSEEDFIKKCNQLIYYARDLMEKEETILYPTSMAMITAEEFEDMKEGDLEIGYAFFTPTEKRVKGTTVGNKTTATAATTAPEAAGFAADLQQLLQKYGYSAAGSEKLDVTTGKLTLEQINLIYQHLPFDISFVDENELVCFYSDTDHRIFPRSKNVIGREVMNCHPRKSAHVVREVIDKLRSGEQDKAEFWINKPDFFLYIIYVAVRDNEGRFRGVIEVMQDCTHIRKLEGSQTLLKWASDNEVPPTAAAPTVNTGDTAHQQETQHTHEMAAAPTVNTGDTAHRQDATTAQTSAPEATAAPDSPTTTATSATASAAEELTPQTRLQDLLDRYPELRNRLTEISSLFAMLRTPFGKMMAKKADIQKMSDRSGVPLDKLMAGLKRIIGELQSR